MLRRALNDPEVQGGEASMAGHLRRIDKGDRSHIGLPVFPLRNFTARDLYVRKDGSVKWPADLVGKRVGMYDWVASGSIWYRHFLRFIGVPPESLQWWIGDIDAPRAPTPLYSLPEGVHRPAEGRSLSEMLIAGELDAIYSPPRPQHYDPVNGPIIRLFPDIRAVERDYFQRTGCFPPQHLIILRRDVWEREKWVARSLTDAFIRCNDQFAAAQPTGDRLPAPAKQGADKQRQEPPGNAAIEHAGHLHDPRHHFRRQVPRGHPWLSCSMRVVMHRNRDRRATFFLSLLAHTTTKAMILSESAALQESGEEKCEFSAWTQNAS